jgi:polar amino acid transport system substrate-binding protein
MIKTDVIAVMAMAAVGLAGCGSPRDPGGSTQRIEGGTLRVGVSENPPWVTRSGDGFAGLEPDLVRALAAQMHATPVWTEGPESRLAPALERGKLDLLIGGFTPKSPWAQTVAVTRDYTKVAGVKHVLLAPPGENRWLLTVDTFLASRTR